LIIGGLQDRDPVVRIAALGLVALDWEGVAEAVRKLTRDSSTVPGLGTVAENATNVLSETDDGLLS
jgi:hypothetical protein